MARPNPNGFFCTLKGHVIDQNNNPKEGLDIEWDPSGAGYFLRIATTDVEGYYVTQISPISFNSDRLIIRVKDQISYLTVSPNITVTADFVI